MKNWIKKKIKERKGFIVIIATILVVLMAYFAISLQETNIRMINFIKNSRNYNIAKSLGSSAMEYLQWRLSHHEAGYNLRVECEMENGVLDAPTPAETAICNMLMANNSNLKTRNARLVMEIKGRSEATEQFTGMCPGLTGASCYVVPFPGTGDAGERCSSYYPDFTNNSAVDSKIGHHGEYVTQSGASGVDYMEQIDYSCNWNKLTFGSSVTDRAAIPFYYDKNPDPESDISDIFNPFRGLGNTASFVLRMRTPCKPCSDPLRDCSGSDETICEDWDRYELNTNDGNEVVVQWQLTGRCEVGGEKQECGLIQYVLLEDPFSSSAISESRINTGDGRFWDHMVLKDNRVEGIDTNTYSLQNLVIISDALEQFTSPLLSLFLSEKLISTEGERIPYLEYQVLSNESIANPRIQLDVIATVNDNTYERTLYRDETKELIDFAVQY